MLSFFDLLDKYSARMSVEKKGEYWKFRLFRKVNGKDGISTFDVSLDFIESNGKNLNETLCQIFDKRMQYDDKIFEEDSETFKEFFPERPLCGVCNRLYDGR